MGGLPGEHRRKLLLNLHDMVCHYVYNRTQCTRYVYVCYIYIHMYMCVCILYIYVYYDIFCIYTCILMYTHVSIFHMHIHLPTDLTTLPSDSILRQRALIVQENVSKPSAKPWYPVVV